MSENSSQDKDVTARERIHEIIFEADTPAGAIFDVTLLIAIILSIVVISLETVEEISGETRQLLAMAKWFFTALFTIEYGFRIYCVKRPWKYITSFWGIVDLLSFLPDYLLLLFQANVARFCGHPVPAIVAGVSDFQTWLVSVRGGRPWRRDMAGPCESDCVSFGGHGPGDCDRYIRCTRLKMKSSVTNRFSTPSRMAFTGRSSR